VSPLPPVDPERNRELMAERMGWPTEALEVCRRLEKAFPRWMVFWASGGLPVAPEPGYRAILKQHRRTTKLYAPTADWLEAALEGRGEAARARRREHDPEGLCPPLAGRRGPVTGGRGRGAAAF